MSPPPCIYRARALAALARHGRSLDPLWPDRTVRLAWLLYQARRYDEAIRELQTVLAADPEAVVVGSDTEVVLGERVFGKPADAEDAAAMLAARDRDAAGDAALARKGGLQGGRLRPRVACVKR